MHVYDKNLIKSGILVAKPIYITNLFVSQYLSTVAYCLSDERLISSLVNKNRVYCDIFLQNIQDRDNVGDLLKTETYSSYITSLLRQVYVMEIIIQFL